MKEKLQEVLKKVEFLDFKEEDKILIKEMIEGMLYYHRLIPKSLEIQVIKCIDICISEKEELDNLRDKLLENKINIEKCENL